MNQNKKRYNIIQINLGNLGSTGGIMMGISKKARSRNFITYQAYPESGFVPPKDENDIFICSRRIHVINMLLSCYSGFNGCFALFSTIKLLAKLDKLDVDLVHLHNLHDSYINIPLLFRWIKKRKVKVVWTLHDCWSFTGQCPHFYAEKCYKWQDGCHDCEQRIIYPQSKYDNTKRMWKCKKSWFNGVEGMVIVTPSMWLNELVKKSFLNGYESRVIYNGIELNVFKPINIDTRMKYNIPQDAYVVLGVAYSWSEKKGIDLIVKIRERLSEKYIMVYSSASLASLSVFGTL